MGWLDALHGQIVGLDSSPLMYYLEKNSSYIERVRPFFVMVANKECSIVTSVVTLLEGLVVPIRDDNQELVHQYYHVLFDIDNIKTLEISARIAEKAAQLRATYKSLKSPDAIQIATAILSGASVFLTNDAQLSSISEIKILVLKNLDKDS